MDDRLIIGIDGDDSGYEKKLRDIKNKTSKTTNEINANVSSKLQKSINNSAEIVNGLNKTVKGLALGIGAVGTTVLGVGISYNSQIEQYTAGFTTMLGNVEKATELLEDLRNFAEKTPFELTDLANASTTLLAFGENIEFLMTDLKMLGDISLGNAEKFRSLALVFGQVQSQGKLMGQDLLQMINAGFNPLQVISQKTGESIASLKDKMAEGEISFEMVADAMKTATSEGGMFYNAMETQSKTLSGQWSTLKDNVTSLTGDIASDISDKLTESVLPDLIKKVEELKQAWADGSLQDSIGTATSCVVAFGVAVGSLNLLLLINDLINVKKGLDSYTAATKLGTTAQKLFNAELLKNPYTLVATALAALVAGIVTYAATHKSEVKKIQDTMDQLNETYKENITSIDKAAESEKLEAEKINYLRDKLFSLDEQLKCDTISQEEANSAKEEFKIIANELNEIIPGITNSIFDETGEINLQRNAVDDLCDSYYKLALAKATANAASKKIEEVQGKILEQKKIQKDAYGKVEEGFEISSEAYAKTRKGKAGYLKDYDKGREQQKDYADVYLKSEELIKGYEEDLSFYMDELVNANKMIDELSDAGNNATERAEENIKKVSSTTKKETKKQTDSIKAQKKQEIKILQNAFETGEISAKEYYNKLNTYRTSNSEVLSELQEEDLNNLKYYHDMGEISDKEYYEELTKFRDRYFETGSGEWQNYTLEIFDYTQELKDKIVDSFNEMSELIISDIEELERTQKSFADKLKNYSNQYAIETITVKPGDGQEDIMYKNAVLPDYNKINSELENYWQLLEKVKERGNVPIDFFGALRDMPIEDGTLMAESLLNLTPEELSEHISGWQKNQQLSDSISKDLYKNEFEELEKNVDNEISLLKTKFEEEFGKLPDNFFDLGSESAENFKMSFVSAIKNVLNDVMKTIGNSMSSVMSLTETATGNGGITNYYSSSYTLVPVEGESTQAQLAAIRDAEQLEKMRGGY